MPAKSNARRADGFKRRLLAWYAKAARDLPWRRTRDPYAILVSEFMLQQTQVSRVLDYWPRFLRRYPTLGDLARARPAAVREAWDGLGYYRRAANLHRLARVVMREYDGVLPHDPSDLETLPGVGHYTAGAVACFAYERPATTVDTNVARVLGRVFRGAGTAAHGGTGLRRLRALHASILPRDGKRAWTLNQALMELGALICVARTPRCDDCPVRTTCAFYRRSRARSARRPATRSTSSSVL
jgi:A/G-specific adenine glycosylase